MQTCIAEIETMRPTKAKVFTVQLFPEKKLLLPVLLN